MKTNLIFARHKAPILGVWGLLLCLLLLSGCEKKEEAVTGITLNQTAATLTIGGTMTLMPIIMPANATNKNVTWNSSITTIATVDSAGLVAAVSPGSATITVTTQDGEKTATCVVVVLHFYAQVNFSISLSALPTLRSGMPEKVHQGSDGYNRNGIILVPEGYDSAGFTAYDATCTHNINDPSEMVSINVDSDSTATCPRCKTVYYIRTGGFSANGKSYLQRYKAALSNDRIYVSY